MKIKMKKKVLPLLMVGLIVLSGSALASRPASYDVKDEEARNTLSKIEGQLETIRKYLEAIDSKESSQDAMEKNETMRTHDSMRKLSVNTNAGGKSATKSFLNSLNTSILGKNVPGLGQLKDLGGLFNKGSGGFLQLLTGSLLQDLNDFDTFIDNKPLCNQPVDEYMEQYSSIIDGSSYSDCSSPDTINQIYLQNEKLLVEGKGQIRTEVHEIKEMNQKMAEKDPEKLEALSEATDTRTNAADSLMGTISTFGNVLGGIKQAPGNPIGIIGKDSLGNILKTEGTESITAAQERTTGTAIVQVSKEARDSKTKDACEKLELKDKSLDDARELNKVNKDVAMAKCETDKLDKINVSKLKLKSAFADEYGHLVN